ncbi:MAG: STAS domain-containing protein [Bacteroidota bacterium]
MAYNISELKSIQVLEVSTLYNEFDNRIILNDVESRIERGLNKFIVDLSNLDFMNSVGLNFMISIMTKSRNSGGDVAVANASEQVLNLLEITKLRTMFTLRPTVEDAIRVFNSN